MTDDAPITEMQCPRCLGESVIHGIKCPTCNGTARVSPAVRAEYIAASERDTAVTIVDPGSKP